MGAWGLRFRQKRCSAGEPGHMDQSMESLQGGSATSVVRRCRPFQGADGEPLSLQHCLAWQPTIPLPKPRLTLAASKASSQTAIQANQSNS